MLDCSWFVLHVTHAFFFYRTNCTDVPGSHVTSFVDVPASDEMALLSAVAMQPISVAIQANQFVFQFYKKGVITDDSCGSRGRNRCHRPVGTGPTWLPGSFCL